MLGHLARNPTVRLARASLLRNPLEGRLLGHLVGLQCVCDACAMRTQCMCKVHARPRSWSTFSPWLSTFLICVASRSPTRAGDCERAILAESRRVMERSRGTELERIRTTPTSSSIDASAETPRDTRPPPRAAARSSSPRPRTIMRGPGAPGSVRVFRLGIAEASACSKRGVGVRVRMGQREQGRAGGQSKAERALMPIAPRCLTNWPTLLFLASTLPFILEWLLARFVHAVALTTPFLCLVGWSGGGVGVTVGLRVEGGG